MSKQRTCSFEIAWVAHLVQGRTNLFQSEQGFVSATDRGTNRFAFLLTQLHYL